jgi:DNA polymerase-3 subunit epsilon
VLDRILWTDILWLMPVQKSSPLYAFVDVETTGASSNYDRVIELAIIRMQDGKILDEFCTVIDPETSLPASITSLTGITQAEIERAPTFISIAQKVHELLKDAIFVAHNARFDYAFIKQELDRAGIKYQAKCLCTVKLSRRLFSKYKKHDLTSIIYRFDFKCENRHRAFSDALVLVDFLKMCEQKFGKEKCAEAFTMVMKRNALPVGLSHEHIDALPESAGVYIFYGEDGDILYIGKSVNIRGRVLSHFADDHRSGKEMRMSQEVTDVEAIETSGELSALLLESHLIKTKQPLYNRKSRHSKELVVVLENINQKGYSELEIERVSDLETLNTKNILGIFRSLKQAKTDLNAYAKDFNLCGILLGIEKNKRGCFFFQIGICKGACLEKESALTYNTRLGQAFAHKRVRSWPFSGPVVIKEQKNQEVGTLFVVNDWRLISSIDYDEVGKREFLPANYKFDYDAYKILVRHMAIKKGIRPISKPELSRLLDGVVMS